MPLLTERGASEEEAKRLLAAMPDPDTQLAEAIAKAPVVVGFNLTATTGKGKPADQGRVFLGRRGGRRSAALCRPLSGGGRRAAGAAEGRQGQRLRQPDFRLGQRRAARAAGVAPGRQGGSLARRRGVARRARGVHGYIGRYAGAQAAKSFGENTGLNAIKIRSRLAGADRRRRRRSRCTITRRGARSGPPLHLGRGYSRREFRPARGSPTTSCWSARRRPGSTI